MGVLDFEAYWLEYFQEGANYYDRDGNLHMAEGVWVSIGQCNAVPAGVNSTITIPDGTSVGYSFTIHIHNPRCREFKYGERLKLTTVFGSEVIELTVKGFARYQLQAKIWA